MASITFTVNGKESTEDVHPDTPLLWVVRDTLGLTGAKFGCGMALCGACTVHLNGEAIRSCVTPVSSVAGKKSPPSRASPPTAVIRCSKPGSQRRCRSVDIANRE